MKNMRKIHEISWHVYVVKPMKSTVSKDATATKVKETVTDGKSTVGKDTAATKVKETVTDGTLVGVSSQQTDAEKTSPADSAAVDEYRAKLAEKRRLAREKAELEAAEQEERRRQQQWVLKIVVVIEVPCEHF